MCREENKMKKILLIVGTSFLLTGCAAVGEGSEFKASIATASQTETAEALSGQEATTSVSETVPAESTTENFTETETQMLTEEITENTYQKMTYREVLENIYYNRNLPLFSEDEAISEDWAIDENDFLIYDIDNDGREELIFRLNNYYTAGMVGLIYDHDADGNLVLQLSAYPSFTFYGNGAIKVNAAHNQGHSGRFWPYSMYRYDSETDLYERCGVVEALDLEIVEMINAEREEINRNDLIEYPYEADTSNSGFVYYIRPDWDRGAAVPVDVTVYNEKDREFTGGTESLEPEFIKLTEENIQNVNQ